MKTTQIILEHLIAGVQATVWIALIILSVFGFDWIEFKLFALQETLLTVVILSFVYPLGIIIDNLADTLLKKKEFKIRKAVPGGTRSLRGLIQQSPDQGLEEYFDYLRMRIRISRSAFLNLSLITLSLFFFIIFRLSAYIKINIYAVVFSELIMGGLLVFLAYYSWYLLTISFRDKIVKRYHELEKNQEE